MEARRKILVQADWGKRPPLWSTMTEREADRWQRQVQELRRTGGGEWYAPGPEEVRLSERAERDWWPITAELMYRLNSWAVDWEEMVSAELLADSGPEATPERWAEWAADGADLAVELQTQLGDEFEVWYQGRRTGQKS